LQGFAGMYRWQFLLATGHVSSPSMVVHDFNAIYFHCGGLDFAPAATK
jgi:hypothetical protein